jgi:hypothetical protein
MERPLVKAAGITTGALFIAIGLSAQFGGAHLFGSPAGQVPSQATQPSPATGPSPSPTPTTDEDSMSAAGTIYAGWGGGKKKHGK